MQNGAPPTHQQQSSIAEIEDCTRPARTHTAHPLSLRLRVRRTAGAKDKVGLGTVFHTRPLSRFHTRRCSLRHTQSTPQTVPTSIDNHRRLPRDVCPDALRTVLRAIRVRESRLECPVRAHCLRCRKQRRGRGLSLTRPGMRCMRPMPKGMGLARRTLVRSTTMPKDLSKTTPLLLARSDSRIALCFVCDSLPAFDQQGPHSLKSTGVWR